MLASKLCWFWVCREGQEDKKNKEMHDLPVPYLKGSMLAMLLDFDYQVHFRQDHNDRSIETSSGNTIATANLLRDYYQDRKVILTNKNNRVCIKAYIIVRFKKCMDIYSKIFKHFAAKDDTNFNWRSLGSWYFHNSTCGLLICVFIIFSNDFPWNFRSGFAFDVVREWMPSCWHMSSFYEEPGTLLLHKSLGLKLLVHYVNCFIKWMNSVLENIKDAIFFVVKLASSLSLYFISVVKWLWTGVSCFTLVYYLEQWF